VLVRLGWRGRSAAHRTRANALASFRTLASGQLIDADRVRAVMPIAPAPSVRLIVPKGAESADAIEVKRSELLLGK
jgi:hypothetical protein